MISGLLFPSLKDTRCCPINLDAEAAEWLRGNSRELENTERNPLLDPTVCQAMLDDFHQRNGADWSYGGYMEDRRRVWRGSYLDRAGNYLHLGVDFNVAQATEIAAGFPCRVMLVDNDNDTDGGWGMRVFLMPDHSLLWNVVLIYAHLRNVLAEAGDALSRGAVFAEVGGPPHNGNWHPHLHVQAVRDYYFKQILVERFTELDGYGHPDESRQLRECFPDPMPYLDMS
ncbi:MAG: peptidoglycan DD-metalloendopeptidase family protein [bacterium]|nr:peptidoglycan DD-metalloendopeptidase family protein [Candidatus Sumerlaeota bacterium]